MKIFISWSGEKSKKVAKLFKDWIPQVLQVVKPWMSEDLEKGSLFETEIDNQLNDLQFGILVLTQENKASRWIHYEAGALFKGLKTARIFTFLVDLENKEIEPPLSKFNHTRPEKADVLRLISSLNSNLNEAAIDKTLLNKTFDLNWPEFESVLRKICGEEPSVQAKPRSTESILEEVLEDVRQLRKENLTYTTMMADRIKEMIYQAHTENYHYRAIEEQKNKILWDNLYLRNSKMHDAGSNHLFKIPDNEEPT